MLVQTFPESSTTTENFYQIVHSTYRRVRIQVARIVDDVDYRHRLKKLVSKIDAVVEVRINPAAKSLIVEHENLGTSVRQFYEKLFETIENARTTDSEQSLTPLIELEEEEINYLERFGLPVFALGLSLLAGPLELGISPLLLTGVLTVAVVIPTWQHTLEKMEEEGHLSVELLEALWSTLHTLQGEFLAPALADTLKQASETLRDLTARSVEATDIALLENRFYWVERAGENQQIALHDLQVDDRILVSCGEKLPVDGIVVEGKALLDQQDLTGVSKLTSCDVGDQVYASTLIVKGQLRVLAQKVGEQTQVYETVSLMQKDCSQDTRVGDYAEEVSNQVIVPAMVVSALVLSTTADWHRAIAPLQLDFGAGIGIAVPTSVIAALEHGVTQGVYIRSGKALERLSQVNAVIFDKTGTLTESTSKIVSVESMHNGVSTDEVIYWAASASYYGMHPVSQMIVAEANERNLQLRACERWHYEIGLGLEATVEGQHIVLGQAQFARQFGAQVDEYYNRLHEGVIHNRSMSYVVKNGELLGVIFYTNSLRPESATVISELQKLGIECHLVTGDNVQVANSVAYRLGIRPSNTHGAAMPERKIEIVEKLKQQGKIVAYVGEGVNDSGALSCAHLSVSFKEGVDLARETADVVLLDDDLRSLIQGVNIARETIDLMYQNVALVAIPNIAVVLAGVFFQFNPVAAVVISNGAMILAALNGLRPLLEGDREKPPITHTTARDEDGLLGVPWQKRPRQSLANLIE